MNARELINKLIAKSGNVIERTMPILLEKHLRLKLDFDFLLRQVILQKGTAFSFIQIGANDGVSREDDLIRYLQIYDIEGIMVEPQPDLYRQLRENMKQFPRVTIINKAIHKNNNLMTLYRIDQSKLSSLKVVPQWAITNGIASFDREHVLMNAHRAGLDEKAIVELEVECITLSNLLKMENRPPDLLKIDTEGYDYEVISMLNFNHHRPSIIHFEHLNISLENYESILMSLYDVGYLFIADKMNTTAYLMID